MKKVLFLIGAAVLVMALATPSMAQFKTWGHIEFGTVWQRNITNSLNTNPLDSDQTRRFIGQRARFYLQYGDPKVVRAVLGFEMDGNWGYSGTTTAASNPGSANNMALDGTDQVAVEVKWAFLEFVIPQTPLTMQIGMQGWYLGGRLFQSRDIPGIRLSADFSPHKVGAFFWRQNEDSNITYEVRDAYGMYYDFVKKNFNLNAYFAYFNQLQNDSFSDRPWFAGVGAGFRPGNWDFWGQFSYVGGSRESKVAGGTDIDYVAYAAELKARYQIGPGLFVGAEAFYSTGNDADETTEFNQFRLADNDECRSNFGNWRSVYFYRNTGVFGPWMNAYQDNFMGTYYLNANIEYSPTAWLRLIANYMYIGDTAEGTPGATGGTGRINTANGAQQRTDEDTIGHEINLIASINIAKGFLFNMGAAYFMPDEDMFKTAAGQDPDDGYAFHTRLIYSF